MIFAGYLIRVKVDKNKLIPEYLNTILNSSYVLLLNKTNVSISGDQANINANKLKNYPIPTPPLALQKVICRSLNTEKEIVDGNKNLTAIYTQKIQDRIDALWCKRTS